MPQCSSLIEVSVLLGAAAATLFGFLLRSSANYDFVGLLGGLAGVEALRAYAHARVVSSVDLLALDVMRDVLGEDGEGLVDVGSVLG